MIYDSYKQQGKDNKVKTKKAKGKIKKREREKPALIYKLQATGYRKSKAKIKRQNNKKVMDSVRRLTARNDGFCETGTD